MRPAPKGMTTLEICVVVAIIGLFATMAVSNMDGVSRKQRERAAIREISMQTLRARAIARTSQYAVRLAVRPNPTGVGTAIRWEQLECATASGRWGTRCPAQQCEKNECGKNGCTCVAVGEFLPVPSTLDVTSLNGLCWRGQGGQPRQVEGGRQCWVDAAVPQTPYKILQKVTNKPDHALQVDGLTGKARMVDCNVTPLPSACN